MASEQSTSSSSRLISNSRQRQIQNTFVRFKRNPKAVLGTTIVSTLIVAAIFGPELIPQEATNQVQVQQRFQSPSLNHPFGTDNFGRDIFLRVIVGSRTSLYIGTLSISIALLVGVPLGSIAGYSRDNIDDAIMRVMDILMSYPPLVFALMLTAILGPSLTNALIALGIVYTPSFARVTRSEVVSVAEVDFVEAAKALGERDRNILFEEILPNCKSPIIVQTTITMAYAILTAAGLSFLGLGVQPPTPAWGLMINQSIQYLERAPWMGFFPGLAIAITVMGFNLIGDGLRDVLDPTLNE